MEIITIILIGIFVLIVRNATNVATERHEHVTIELASIIDDLKQIKSGVATPENSGLNPNLFDIAPEKAGIVEKKNQEIINLKKNIENLNKQIKILRTWLNT